PEIGAIRTTPALSFTAPDFRHASSASARQGSRSSIWKNPRPQPASETRTREPTRYKRTPRVIRASSMNLLKDSSTLGLHESLTTSRRPRRNADDFADDARAGRDPPA